MSNLPANVESPLSLSRYSVLDDMEEDELDVVPKSKKTKTGGYLKDGFVVDDDENGDGDDDDISGSSDESDEDDDTNDANANDTAADDGLILEDIGSELSEEDYDYSE